jgi:trehalose 6-phosphate phosphatase
MGMTPTPHSWSPAARTALENLLKVPETTGICVDFDGTLAEIVSDPMSAAPLPGVLDTLDRLVSAFGVVGVVSGRPGAFLSERLDVASRAHGLAVYGLYGSERVEASGAVVALTAKMDWSHTLEEVALNLRRFAPQGCTVEQKDTSVALHWRAVPAHAAQAYALASNVAHSYGLSLFTARKAVELIPPGTPDKGDVVAELLRDCTAACVLGDDEGDLAAFVALERLRDEHHIVAIRIAVNSDEAPKALIETADCVLNGPHEASLFLSALAQDGASRI